MGRDGLLKPGSMANGAPGSVAGLAELITAARLSIRTSMSWLLAGLSAGVGISIGCCSTWNVGYLP